MIAQRLLLLFIVLAGGFGALWLLPRSGERPAPGVSMELPNTVGRAHWVGQDEEVSEKERKVLGEGTTFARKSYINARGDQIYVSIVMAGDDMNTSIHRPEMCLPAQGYTIINSAPTRVRFGEQSLTATRLHNQRNLPLVRGGHVVEYSLDYYWFIGSSETTHSHLHRNLIDIRDRFLYGHNQPWAFIMVIAQIGEGLRPFGLSEAETDEMVREFMAELIPEITSPSLQFR